jgi:hypothetical protein
MQQNRISYLPGNVTVRELGQRFPDKVAPAEVVRTKIMGMLQNWTVNWWSSLSFDSPYKMHKK